jgi:hypothetical protein
MIASIYRSGKHDLISPLIQEIEELRNKILFIYVDAENIHQ